ncbi:ABC transporter ATP-binding protein [Leptothoe spongobia]|uniref:ABC-type quaternary amine transporter n=1 Tax=Leptothoe spongobia TAU-MAC 1115 TaxID=1967444 RepID=A0A947GIR0_9CYAN|nr:ABC transporter ATP-binding protein [Leptothoe spongobia]MBT9315879.1 ABC transporter ATP-binding protein [Leptothoe spongobia TAU-MAC 1115]
MPTASQVSNVTTTPLPTVLELHNVTKQYQQQTVPAINQVSLQLRQGELLALLGPSGCGKTTLLRTIAGFENPEKGWIELAKQPVCGQGTTLPPERRDVGIVFQDYALFPHLCVIDNVSFGLKHLGRHRRLPNAQIQTLAQEAISLVGLAGFERRYPHELSGGQQQRVALARALAPRPSLVLLDEPFSNLDVQVRLYLRQEVRSILKGVGASGIFVTHDQQEALAIADRVAVMRAGRIEQLASPEEIYEQPASQFIADFVTQANFLKAQRSAGGWKTALGLVDTAMVNPTDATQGMLMLRQEELYLKAVETDAEMVLVICDREFLGREYKYTLNHPSLGKLKARTPIRFATGDTVQVSVKPNPYGLRVFV